MKVALGSLPPEAWPWLWHFLFISRSMAVYLLVWSLELAYDPLGRVVEFPLKPR